MIASTLLFAAPILALGAELPVTVLQLDGRPLDGAVVIAEPAAPAARARAQAIAVPEAPAVMDQRDLSFVPNVLVVRTGSAVEFPNSDKVRHQVYSFSGAKNFKLSLYAGRAHPPVVFDKAGLVTLGCNIHDGMIGYVLVTDSPWVGRTDSQGRTTLTGLPESAYVLRVWHPRIADAPAQLQREIEVRGAPTPLTFQLARKLKPALHNHGTNQRWDDY